MENLLRIAYRDYDQVLSRCDTFNKVMYVSALDAGGDHYAQFCVAAYRQSIAAHALTKSPQGEILFLSQGEFLQWIHQYRRRHLSLRSALSAVQPKAARRHAEREFLLQ